jgi:hypothetical protein
LIEHRRPEAQSNKKSYIYHYMITPKIIELLLDENSNDAGLDGIALVENPAHEALFEYFSEEEPKYHVLGEDEIPHALEMFSSYGEPQGLLEREGWKIVKVEEIGHDHKTFSSGRVGEIDSEPNKISEIWDTADTRIRFKYVGPRDEKNRPFCAEMLRQKRVFRAEDLDTMSRNNVNPIGPDGYSILEWRGSYNCRHKFVKLTYKKEGVIINDDRITKGVINQQDYPGPDTRTTATIAAGNTPPRDSFKKQKFESYTDYPQYMSDAAQAALDWIDETGNPNDCMTQVGKVRANQLAKREPISLDTINRMKSYISRHLVDLDSSTSFEDGCGKLAMSSWGCRTKDECNSALGWLDRKISSVEEDLSLDVSTLPTYTKETSKPEKKPVDMLYDNPCQTGYIAYGTKIKDGKEVPNCVKMKKDFSAEMSFEVFNSEERLVVGPAMIPDKLIVRRSESYSPGLKPGEIYYVYFSKDTIKELSFQFNERLMLNRSNIEHSDDFLNDVSVVESWIVEDREKDKQQVFGMNYPEGTWMITMKVKNDKVWNMVKEGKLKGYSVQGYFIENAKFSKSEKTILSEIKDILNKIQ